MIEPMVYWRRRIVATVATVMAGVLLVWIIGSLVGGAEEPTQSVAAVRSSAPPSSRPPVNPSSSTTSPTPAPPAIPAPPPGPPQRCPDTAIAIAAETGAPSYPVGQRPLLRLVVANIGAVPCIRDVSRTLRELVITSSDGAHRLWSSNDCYAPPEADSRTMQPGERLTFTVNWAGRTSAPGCPARRQTLPAGTYLVIGKLGALSSKPVPLALT